MWKLEGCPHQKKTSPHIWVYVIPFAKYSLLCCGWFGHHGSPWFTDRWVSRALSADWNMFPLIVDKIIFNSIIDTIIFNDLQMLTLRFVSAKTSSCPSPSSFLSDPIRKISPIVLTPPATCKATCLLLISGRNEEGLPWCRVHSWSVASHLEVS